MKKIKMFTAVFAFVGMASVAGYSTTSPTSVVPADAQSCAWCCPPDVCGVNGPDFDGTTVDDNDSSCEEQAR